MKTSDVAAPELKHVRYKRWEPNDGKPKTHRNGSKSGKDGGSPKPENVAWVSRHIMSPSNYLHPSLRYQVIKGVILQVTPLATNIIYRFI